MLRESPNKLLFVKSEIPGFVPYETVASDTVLQQITFIAQHERAGRFVGADGKSDLQAIRYRCVDVSFTGRSAADRQVSKSGRKDLSQDGIDGTLVIDEGQLPRQFKDVEVEEFHPNCLTGLRLDDPRGQTGPASGHLRHVTG